ncbi:MULTISPECIES: hypothetical protein [Streptomyces]|uniref:hypothetical protein n=1 Tax=Streptomyces TaxID=1883 RepID=UPI001291F26B|nr:MULTISPECIES: hypothetical protein [Streptomyces]KAF2779132.1 hypothetical protein STPH1_3798 [Streptomyces sp. OM5714]MCX5036847.1 hypothetical protein [Streptomyces coelicoflavus]QFX83052.1 hypothetical protein GEV49_20665 [Streptomyces sp. SYP-A7193]
MSATPGDPGRVDLRRRRITPRRLGAAAVVYGVFVAGWYLGQPVTPECRPDRAALDRAAERYGHVPVSTPTPTPTPVAGPAGEPSAIARHSPIESADTLHILTATAYAVPCGNDTGELPRLAAWFDGAWR